MRFSKKLVAGALCTSMLASAFSLTGCGNKYVNPNNDSDALVVTMGDNKMYMDEAKCYIYFSEVQGQNTSDLYILYGIDNDHWNSKSYEDSNKTNAQQIQATTLDKIVEEMVLYADALSTDKYKVTDADKEVFKQNAQALIDCMSDKQLKKTGFTVDDFVRYQEKKYIADSYKEDIIDGFGVTEESVSKDIDFENRYRAYETTYLRLSITTQDSSGNDMEVSDKKKDELMKIMEEVKKKVDKGEKFEDIAKEYSSKGVTSSTITYTKGEFKDISDPSAGYSIQNPDYICNTIEMGNGKISKIFEADGYYYIARMEDNESTVKYDEQVDFEIDAEETKQYEKWLKELKEGDYKYTVNEEVWDSLDFGELTIIQDEFKKAWGTLEDPAAKKK